MDSKNVIWLSSFFALLFVTFCVTRHLDDLNPNIVSLPNHTANKEVIALNNSTQQSVIAQKLETQKLETQKLETQKLETQKLETQKLETQKLETQKALPTTTSTSVEKNLSYIEEIQKSVPIKSHPIVKKKHIDTKVKEKSIKHKTITKKKKSYKRVPLGRIHLDTTALNMIQKHQNINELNKLSYMYTIHKDSQVRIATSDKTSANVIKRYLLGHHVNARDIHIVRENNQKNLIKITLTGRK